MKKLVKRPCRVADLVFNGIWKRISGMLQSTSHWIAEYMTKGTAKRRPTACRKNYFDTLTVEDIEIFHRLIGVLLIYSS